MHRIFAGLAVWTVAAFVAVAGLGVAVWAAKGGDPALAQRLFTWHMLGGIFLATLTCVLHIMTMFHFIGSGKEIKEAAELLGEDGRDLVAKVRLFKRQTSALATFAPALMGAAVILGGLAHTQPAQAWVHWTVGVAALFLNLMAFPVEYRALKANLDLIGEVDRRLKREVAPALFREAD